MQRSTGQGFRRPVRKTYVPPGYHPQVIDARPRISVIIPARNEAATIERAIRPFLVDGSIADVEIIVAEGRSTDGTRAVVEAMAQDDSRIHVVPNPTGRTPDALNAAIAASRGDVIVRMDGHADPAPDYLVACLAVLASSGAWNVGGRMVKTGKSRAAKAVSAASTSPFGIGGGLRYHLASEPMDLPHVWLGCWPRWVFERVGLFDPEMVRNQDEELDRRILDAGGTIRFDPAIHAIYKSRRSWSAILQQYVRYGIYRVRAVQKHPGMLNVRHLMPPALVALIVISFVAACFEPAAGLIAAISILGWLAGASYFARAVAAEFGSAVPDVVTAYACIHFGYGVGFWIGAVQFAPRWFWKRRGAAPALLPRDSPPVP